MHQKHTLMMLNPGHFHAALTLRESHPLIDDDVHVFAEFLLELLSYGAYFGAGLLDRDARANSGDDSPVVR